MLFVFIFMKKVSKTSLMVLKNKLFGPNGDAFEVSSVICFV